MDYVVDTLKGAQLRVDHSDSVRDVVGKVPECNKLTITKDPTTGKDIPGEVVAFKAIVNEPWLISKILKKLVDHVSIQIDSDEVECSGCHKPTRQNGMLMHICPKAWEIIHKPRVRELSIVASPAYQSTGFKPVGFGAAVDADQKTIFEKTQQAQKLEAARQKLLLHTKVATLLALEGGSTVGF